MPVCWIKSHCKALDLSTTIYRQCKGTQLFGDFELSVMYNQLSSHTFIMPLPNAFPLPLYMYRLLFQMEILPPFFWNICQNISLVNSFKGPSFMAGVFGLRPLPDRWFFFPLLHLWSVIISFTCRLFRCNSSRIKFSALAEHRNKHSILNHKWDMWERKCNANTCTAQK